MDIFQTHRDIVQEVDTARNSGKLRPEPLIQFNPAFEQVGAAHHRFSKLLKDRTRYQVVEPVLPMDVLGVYIVLPEVV